MKQDRALSKNTPHSIKVIDLCHLIIKPCNSLTIWFDVHIVHIIQSLNSSILSQVKLVCQNWSNQIFQRKENCFESYSRLIEWQKLHFHVKKMYIMKFILFRSVSSGDSRLSSKHKKSKKSKHHRRSPSSSPERSRRRSRSRSRRRSPSLERGRYRSRSRSRSRDRYSRRRSRSRDRRSRSYDRRSRSSSHSRRRSRYSRSLSRDRQRSKRYDILKWIMINILKDMNFLEILIV